MTRVTAKIVIGGETVCEVAEEIQYSLSCHVETVATQTSGPTGPIQRKLGDSMDEFTWIIKYPTACVAENEIVVESFTHNDDGALVTIHKKLDNA